MDKSLVFNRYYNLSLRFLSYRPRSEKEVYDYLKTKTKRAPDLTEEVIAQIMKRLVELHFVDDLGFAKFWIENRKKAFNIVKLELAKKGVNKDIVEEAASSFNILQKDEKLMQKLIEKKKKLEPQKLTGYLMRRGFSYNEIRKHLKS